MPDPSMTPVSIDWVALSATVSGFVLGAMGLYFTFRSRTASMREQLHRAQLDLVAEIAAHGAIVMHACQAVSLADDEQHRNAMRATARTEVKTLLALAFKAMALLPKESAKQANLCAGFALAMTHFDHPKERDQKLYETVSDYHWRFIEEVRKDLAIDALGDEIRKMVRNKTDENWLTTRGPTKPSTATE